MHWLDVVAVDKQLVFLYTYCMCIFFFQTVLFLPSLGQYMQAPGCLYFGRSGFDGPAH